ncbi:MAG TPA: 16S rRNA (guanine(966)-N(2))-methyltransferase RsmD [Rhodocyclaceae bacterium]|nr:16S rRNA (guanine(966)-N(2))-methyltransferase RsmD [Rhodocyclaceae bacterium]
MSRIRIVGGQWRSRLIDVPDAIGLRPTPDRVREILFNWLGQDLSGLRCLDLFAGSGALGFEAASRGAAEVVLVENAPYVYEHLKSTAAKLKADNLRLIKADAVKFLHGNSEQFDIIFLDPPYKRGWLDQIEPLLDKTLTSQGRVYAESEQPVTQLGGLRAIKTGRAGQVHYQLLCFEDDQ